MMAPRLPGSIACASATGGVVEWNRKMGENIRYNWRRIELSTNNHREHVEWCVSVSQDWSIIHYNDSERLDCESVTPQRHFWL